MIIVRRCTIRGVVDLIFSEASAQGASHKPKQGLTTENFMWFVRLSVVANPGPNKSQVILEEALRLKQAYKFPRDE